ncbi:hypothetical protein ACOSP7_007184 [Xanthoceras sorbifolium]
MEAEYQALAQATTEIVWLRSLFSELGIHIPTCPVLWCDNTSAVSLALNPIFHARTKHIEIDVHFVHEKVAAKAVSIQYVPTLHQKANIFTKALPQPHFDF